MKSKNDESLINQYSGLTSLQPMHNTQIGSSKLAENRPAALKRIPKNNSFNDKDPSVKEAMQASLAATDESDVDSPYFRRGRGMTEGVDEHQIHLLNANTQGMIKHQVSQLHRHKSPKRQQRQSAGLAKQTSAAAAPSYNSGFSLIRMSSTDDDSQGYQSKVDLT